MSRLKHILLTLLVAFIAFSGNAQKNYKKTIKQERKEFKKTLFKTNDVLYKGEQKKLKKLQYFPIDESWKINAIFEADTGEVFLMPTTTERTPRYQRVGWLHISHGEDNFKLAGYKSLDLKGEEYENYVFIPFRDGNSPEFTYGGGRYIDVNIPPNTSFVEIDFNQAYNPYCVYSYRYSCPITPEENWTDAKINAGVKNPRIKE